MNLEIRQLEDILIKALNESELPIEVKRLIVADVYHQILKEADKIIAQEVKEAIDEQSVQPN